MKDKPKVDVKWTDNPNPKAPEWPVYVEHGGPAFCFAKLDPSGPEQGVRLYDWKGGTAVFPFRPDTAAFLRKVADAIEDKT